MGRFVWGPWTDDEVRSLVLFRWRAHLVLEALVSFLILLVVVCVVAGLVLWAVGRFFPEVATPARYIVGAIALIVILYALLNVMRGGVPGLP